MANNVTQPQELDEVAMVVFKVGWEQGGSVRRLLELLSGFAVIYDHTPPNIERIDE